MHTKMQSAFKGVMPANAVMAASHMHGVREAYHHKSSHQHVILGCDELLPQREGLPSSRLNKARVVSSCA